MYLIYINLIRVLLILFMSVCISHMGSFDFNNKVSPSSFRGPSGAQLKTPVTLHGVATAIARRSKFIQIARQIFDFLEIGIVRRCHCVLTASLLR